MIFFAAIGTVIATFLIAGLLYMYEVKLWNAGSDSDKKKRLKKKNKKTVRPEVEEYLANYDKDWNLHRKVMKD